MLVKTAGVRKLVVVINKMDDPTVQWSEDRWVLNSNFLSGSALFPYSNSLPTW